MEQGKYNKGTVLKTEAQKISYVFMNIKYVRNPAPQINQKWDNTNTSTE